MKKVMVKLGANSYEIIIDSDILDQIGNRLKEFGFSKRMALISNPTVFSLFGERVLNSVGSAGFDVSHILIPDGEEYKDIQWLHYILSELLKLRLDRKSSIIALGGGVIGDITGFAASLYMRGINYIQLPTTLLSQVDSSVGGKTGVNHQLGKNMIGSFYQPSLVWIDTDTLKTLPKREFLAGISEIIKYGIIRDRSLFNFLKENREAILSLDKHSIEYIIEKSCQIKADIVSRDEKESGLRTVLNYGHTIGHAIETLTDYKRYLHGEAIAIGMCISARIASSLSFINNTDVEEVIEMIELFELPIDVPDDLNKDDILHAMVLDKKTISGEIRFILPERIGSVKIVGGIDREIVLSALSN